jgi:histidinol-phosphate aminotransferase
MPSAGTSRRELLRGASAALCAAAVLRPDDLGAGAREPGTTSKAGEGGLVRLDRNENPYGPSEKARQAIRGAIAEGNRYVEDARRLEEEIARREGLTPEHVVLAPGSHAVLCMAGLAYGLGGGEILGADLTYEGLFSYAEAIGARVTRVPLTSALAHDLPAFERRLTGSTRLVFVCNPNNPTGTLLKAAELRDFCLGVERKAAVLVDEAYIEYVDPEERATMVPLVREGRNVLVSRTFSKLYGLAGLRVGYALARPDVAERLRRLRMGGSAMAVNALGLRAALASLDDVDFAATTRRRTATERAAASSFLASRGIVCPPAHASFLHLVPPPPLDAEGLGRAMEARGVRLAARKGAAACRLTIGTPEEMTRFRAALDDVLGAAGIPKAA